LKIHDFGWTLASIIKDKLHFFASRNGTASSAASAGTFVPRRRARGRFQRTAHRRLLLGRPIDPLTARRSRQPDTGEPAQPGGLLVMQLYPCPTRHRARQLQQLGDRLNTPINWRQETPVSMEP